MASRNEFLDQDCARVSLTQGQGEMSTYGIVILQMDSYATALTAIEGFNNDWITDVAGRGYGAVPVGDAHRPGNREAGGAQRTRDASSLNRFANAMHGWWRTHQPTWVGGSGSRAGGYRKPHGDHAAPPKK